MTCRFTKGCFSHMASNRVPCAVLHRFKSPKTDMVLAEPPRPVGSGMTVIKGADQHGLGLGLNFARDRKLTIQRPESASIKSHVHAQVVRLQGIHTKVGRIREQVQVRDEGRDRSHGDLVVELGCDEEQRAGFNI